MPMCDVCNQSVTYSDSYALTTHQVVADPAYWRFILNKHEFDEDTLLLYIQQQAMQRSGWLVCEACSHRFHFDRPDAKQAAMRQVDPKDSGPADGNHVAAAAARAWHEKHGHFPHWLQSES